MHTEAKQSVIRQLALGPNQIRLSQNNLLEALFVTQNQAQQYADLIMQAQDQDIWCGVVSEKIMRGLAATTTPPGIVGVAHSIVWDVDQFAQALTNIPKQGNSQNLAHNSVVLTPSIPYCSPIFTLLPIMIDIADPGNVGTIVRLADTFGADAVFFVGNSADSLNGKVIRASAGSLFHLPIIQERDITKALDFVRNHSLRLVATTLDGELTLPQADTVLQQPTAWLFGNEAHGLAAEVVTQAQKTVRIPMFGQAESLNVATAASICLYASALAQHKVS